MTPFSEIDLKISVDLVSELLRRQEAFARYGVAHIEDIASGLLARNGVQRTPYALRLAVTELNANLPDSVFSVGRGLVVDHVYGEVIDPSQPLKEQRKTIFEWLRPLTSSRDDFLKDLPETCLRVLEKLL